MARKTYSEEFRRDAVELYRVTGGATIGKIAGDLGITDATLSAWIKAAGVTVRGRHGAAAVSVDPGDELARLRARVSELEADRRTLSTSATSCGPRLPLPGGRRRRCSGDQRA